MKETLSEIDTSKQMNEALSAIANNHAEKIAINDNGVLHTYAKLEQDATHLAQVLIHKKYSDESIVAVLLEPGYDFFVSILAVLKAGLAYLPIDPDYPQERINYLVEDSKASLVITMQDQLYKVTAETVNVLNLSQPTTVFHSNTVSEYKSKVDKPLAYVIYTSGSTGKPKGVMIEHSALLASTRSRLQHYKQYPVDKFILLSSVSFDSSIAVIYWTLMSGATVVVPDKSLKYDVIRLRDFLKSEKISHLLCVPSLYNLLIEQCSATEDLPLKLAVVVGDKVNMDLLTNHAQTLPAVTLVNEYGPTEATVWSTYSELYNAKTQESASKINIGSAVNHCETFVINEHKLPIASGIGELYIAGSGLARGYLHHTQLTQEKFVRLEVEGKNSVRAYKTGDIVNLQDGRLQFLHRADRQVKISGYRIDLSEVDDIISKIPEVAISCAFGVPVTNSSKKLAVAIVPHDRKNNQRLDHLIKQQMEKQLPDYMIPKITLTLNSLPLTLNGKVDVKQLIELANRNESNGTNQYTYANENEKSMAQLWSTVLGVMNVDPTRDFFTLGGDSIQAIRLVALARKKNIHLSVAQIYQFPTVRRLTPQLSGNISVAQRKPINTKGVFRLTPIQMWFFKQEFKNPNHWNQSVLVELSKSYSDDQISQSICELLLEHDVFRLQFKKTDKGWSQEYIDAAKCDFKSKIVFVEDDDITKISENINASMNVINNDLFRFVVVKQQQRKILFICLHHLIIDGVSWRILLDDLSSLLRGVDSGCKLKSNSLKDWSEYLHNYFLQDRHGQEKNYWLTKEAKRNTFTIGCDADEGTQRDVVTLSFDIDAEHTKKLLLEVPKAYDTKINDILLSALMLTVQRHSNMHELTIQLEGHGREQRYSGLDLSKSVGWFTTVFPICLNIPHGEELSAIILAVKEQLAAVPTSGLGYGILRYLHDEEFDTDTLLGTDHTPDILFNYLGQWSDNNNEHSDIFKYLSNPGVDSIGGANDRSTKLDINSLVLNDQFLIELTFNTIHFKRQTIENFGQLFCQSLSEIIDHCAQKTRVLNASPKLYPLSPMQSGMFYHSMLNNNSDEYLVQSVYEFTGAIDLVCLQKAWISVVNECDALRSIFVLNQETRPSQIIVNDIDLPWIVTDWSRKKYSDLNSSLEKYLKKQRSNLFSMQELPLFKVELIQITQTTHLMVFSHHHIILDGWSSPLLMDRLSEHYRAIVNNDKVVEDEKLCFGRYLNWHDQQDKSAAKRYWQYALANISEFNYLTDLSLFSSDECKVEKNPHKKISKYLNGSGLNHESLMTFCQEHSVTLSTLLQGAWGALLSWYLQSDEVIYGLTISGRTADLNDVDKIIGLLINTVPMRVTLSNEESAVEYLKKVQLKVMQVQEHNQLSLSEIQSYANLKDDKKLFDHIFVVENYPQNDIQFQDGLHLTSHNLGNIEKTEFPLVVSVQADSEKAVVSFNFKESYFSKPIIERLYQHYTNVLAYIINHPHANLQQSDFLTMEEKNKQINIWQKNKVPVTSQSVCIHEIIEQQAQRFPDSIAVLDNQAAISYKQLNESANQIACYLRQKGVMQDDIVAIALPRCYDQIVATLAVLKAGGAYLPLDPEYPQARLLYMLNDSNAKLLITNSQLKNDYQGFHGEILVIDDLQQVAQLETLSTENPKVDVNSKNLAYVIYTSGSTGKPKGVLLEHAAVYNYLQWARVQYNADEQAVIDYSSSLSFDLSVTCTLLPLFSGSTIGICSTSEKQDLQQYYQHLVKHKVKMLKSTPSYFRLLASYMISHQLRLDHLQVVILGGEQLCKRDVSEFIITHSHCSIYNEYGPTEATVGCSIFKLTDQNLDSIQDSVPIGTPINNAQLQVLDKHDRLLPAGIAGKLFIGGAGLARGYLNKRELTAQRFTRKGNALFYDSGDIVRWDEAGILSYVGRTDKLVKIRGFRVELGAIEQSICAHDHVAQCLVTLSKNNQTLIAFITTNDKQRESATLTAEINDYLKNHLPQYMLPKQIILFDQFPLTTNGKVDSKLLQKEYLSTVSTEEKYTAPRNATEYKLLTIWQDVLKRNNISIFDDFFEVGGHSLTVLELIIRIKQVLAYELSIVDVHECRTIEKMAKYLEQKFGLQTVDSNKQLLEIVPGRVSQNPLFLIHAIEGISFVYKALSSYINNFPVYAINSRTFCDPENKRGSVEEIADEYLEMIMSKQPKGPYRIGGWCFGGKVAYEIACKLRERGEKVETVILIDSYLLERYRDQKVYDDVAFDKSIREYVKGEGVDPSSYQTELFKQEIKSNILCSYSHKPKKYDGSVVLIKATVNKNKDDVDFNDPFNNCRGLLTKDPKVYHIDCDHSALFNEKNVAKVADALNDALIRACSVTTVSQGLFYPNINPNSESVTNSKKNCVIPM